MARLLKPVRIAPFCKRAIKKAIRQNWFHFLIYKVLVSIAIALYILNNSIRK